MVTMARKLAGNGEGLAWFIRVLLIIGRSGCSDAESHSH